MYLLSSISLRTDLLTRSLLKHMTVRLVTVGLLYYVILLEVAKDVERIPQLFDDHSVRGDVLQVVKIIEQVAALHKLTSKSTTTAC